VQSLLLSTPAPERPVSYRAARLVAPCSVGWQHEINLNFRSQVHTSSCNQAGAVGLSITNEAHEKPGTTSAKRIGRAERDVVALGIAIASIVMFVGIGGSVVSQTVLSLIGGGVGPDRLLASALLLNIALIIFGWRRYHELTQEVSERRKAEEQAKVLAETDPLTLCLNRRSVGPATDHLIAAAAESGEAVAFIMVDVDKFKQINDVHGHRVGDAVLRACADRISGLLPDRALLARLGGDEFACVVRFDRLHPEQIDRVATAITESIVRPIATDTIQVETSVSLGIARCDSHPGGSGTPADAQQLLHMADIAMYHAKKEGRNRYCWFEATMESDLRMRSELETGIRTGILRGEFEPYYEQQIDLGTGELVGFEMLARWNAPSGKIIGPDVFIPIAEEIGMIAQLSEAVIAQALRDAKAWNPRLTLSVNISPIQLRDPWFAQKLLKLLIEANFPPERLDIEITESCLHENVTVVRTLITSLRNQGIRVSLDDFGTGYSSLAQLRSLPFDQIKIDRSFVTNLMESADSETIVKAITSLGIGLGMPVTAEGVETEDVLKRLQGYGNYKGQGYLYGRPQPATAVKEMLASRNLLAQVPPDEEVPTVPARMLEQVPATKPRKRSA
jgi:diguanylate cyclase (GGDEF)-like protein